MGLGPRALARRQHVLFRIRQPIEHDRLARLPIGGGLQNRRPGKPAMGKERFAETRLARAGSRQPYARKRAHPPRSPGPNVMAQAWPRGRDAHAELLCDLERKAARARFGIGAAAGHAQRLAFKNALICLNHKAPRRTAMTRHPVRSAAPAPSHSSSSMRTIFCDARAPSQKSCPSVFS